MKSADAAIVCILELMHAGFAEIFVMVVTVPSAGNVGRLRNFALGGGSKPSDAASNSDPDET
jgi:hypothetical protein